jgi:hypothetical protein
MEIDTDKIDDTVLALLFLTSFPDNGFTRAWKGHDWDAMNRLSEKGMISDPRSKSKSVVLTEEGVRRSEELFKKIFAKTG